METTPSMCAARGKLEKMRWPTQRAKCTPSHTLLMTTTVAPWVVILHAHSMQTIVSIGGVTQGTLTHLHAAASLELSRTRDVAKVPAAGRVCALYTPPSRVRQLPARMQGLLQAQILTI